MPFSGSRMMLEKNPEAARFGSPGTHAERGQANAYAIEYGASRVVVDQQLNDRLLDPIARCRRHRLLVADDVGKRWPEDRDR